MSEVIGWIKGKCDICGETKECKRIMTSDINFNICKDCPSIHNDVKVIDNGNKANINSSI
jgi:ribosome-binding protein aMBF1 (putative translation factor)